MIHSRRYKHGFTIVELLIVIVVIGILASLVIVSYNGITNRANEKSAQSAVAQANKAIMSFAVQNSDSFPANLTDVNVNDSSGTTFSYVVYNSTTPKKYCVSATVGSFTYFMNTTTAMKPTTGGCLDAATVTTFAGTGSAGSTNGTGTAASFNNPQGMVWNGGNLYVADRTSNLIRRITPAGVVTTFAGSGTAAFTNGTGTAASFNNPADLAFDSLGNMFVADSYNHSIRRITPAGVVTTFAGLNSQGFADGAGATVARFNFPFGITIDAADNLYVTDTYNYRIRKITPSAVVSTLAGSAAIGSVDGSGASAQFNLPYGIAIDSTGNLYVSETGSHRIRKVTSTGVVTTPYGSTQGYLDGTGTAARFNNPLYLALDGYDNLFVVEGDNNRIRKVVVTTGVVTTVAGSTAGYTNGLGTNAQFSAPIGIALDSSGALYVSERTNQRIRKLEF